MKSGLVVLLVLGGLLWGATPQAQAVVYLCPTDGIGTEADPFRSRAVTELLAGRGNIDIRQDVTKPGLMLCESDALPDDTTGVIVLGNERNTVISGQARADMATALNITIRGAVVEDAIKELVIPTLPLPKSRTYDIHLGRSRPVIKEVASLSNDIYYKGLAVAVKDRGQEFAANTIENLRTAMAWATVLPTETFNCTNANPIATCVHTWAGKLTPRLEISSNQALGDGTTAEAADYVTTGLSTTDVEISATFIGVEIGAGTATSCAVFGRTTADATITYYAANVTRRTSGELNDVSLRRRVAGASTTLATDTTDWVANDIIAIRMVGTTISTRKNNFEVLTVTDGNITTGNYAGLYLFATDTAGSCTWDNWNAADYSGRLRGGSLWLP